MNREDGAGRDSFLPAAALHSHAREAYMLPAEWILLVKLLASCASELTFNMARYRDEARQRLQAGRAERF